jgi:hypothetical protein
LRVNLNKTPSTKHSYRSLRGLQNIRVSTSNRSDVIYEYLKTFSNYSNQKKGVLINFNQHIAYNFNSKNLLVRAAKAQAKAPAKAVNNNSLGLQNTFQSNLFSFTESFNSNSILLQSNNHQSNSKVFSALDQQYPNLKDSFINSPLEENIIPHIINVLSNNLHLHFIILYLLIMLLIIITCKYILKDNIEFTKIQNNPLGA